MRQLEFYQRVLGCFAFDYCDDLWWRLEHGTHGDPSTLGFFVNVNDVFEWGTADVEPITPETLPELEQAFADVRAVTPEAAGEAAMLYAARRRKTRPQGAMYKYLDASVQHLFDAVGPRREVDILNPHPHPSEVVPDPYASVVNTSTSVPYTAKAGDGYIAPSQQ